MHIHCVIEYTKKIDTKNVRYFDITYKGVEYHPHIKTLATKDDFVRAWEYCTKEDLDPLFIGILLNNLL